MKFSNQGREENMEVFIGVQHNIYFTNISKKKIRNYGLPLWFSKTTIYFVKHRDTTYEVKNSQK